MKKYMLFTAFIVGILTHGHLSPAQTGIITTVAGSGYHPVPLFYSGDGGPATNAGLGQPTNMAVDSKGRIFIADRDNNVIRKVDTNGIITTIAGTGYSGFFGDGGPATAAEFYGPTGIVIDHLGNLLVADEGNNRIRKINTSGTITTIAGNGFCCYANDGGRADTSRIAVADIALDTAGNIYFTDVSFRIRKITLSTGLISTVAGTGTLGFTGDGGPATAAEISNCWGLTLDDTGNIYIADAGNNRIRKVNTSGIIKTIAGHGLYPGETGDGGLADTATLNYPWDVAIDSFGNYYITDYGTSGDRIRRVNSLGYISTITGTGVLGYSGDGGISVGAKIYYPNGIICDKNGNVYFADVDNYRIRKITFSYGIGVSPADSVCAGTPVTFTANSIAGCTSPSYSWHLNGSIVGSTSNTYSYTPSNGDSMYCVMTCFGGAVHVSSTIHMRVKPIITPTNHITSFLGDTVCLGTMVTYLATSTGGGGTPTYKWFVNGTLVSTGSSPAYAYIPLPGDNVKCTLISSVPCATPATITSNTIHMIVDSVLTPSITIVSSSGDTICPGTLVTFTATSIGGGTVPAYQWKVNGINVGTGLPTYSYVPSSGDSIECVLTSTSPCATTPTAYSNIIHMVVRTIVPPSVTITAYPGDTACSGTAVNFVAIPLGGGTIPTYQWRKNTVIVGSSPSFSYVPASADSLICVLTSNQTCEVGVSVVSNTIHMTVESVAPSGISIVASPGDTICDGQAVIFNATSTMGGGTPFYQWAKNGSYVGSGGSSYTYLPANGDYIQCSLTSSDICASPSTAISNMINIVSDPIIFPSISLSGPAGANIGEVVTITATVLDAGSSFDIFWMNYGIQFATTTGTSVSYTKTSGIDVITAKVVSTSVGCYDSASSFVLLVDLPDNDKVSIVTRGYISIYPNPATNELFIKTDQDTYTSITITNTLGQTLIQQAITTSQTKVNIGSLPAGVYYVTLKGADGNAIQKFVKL